MDVELIEIRDFLAAHPPFDQLPAECLDRLPRQFFVRYLRRGSPFPPRDGSPALLLLRSGAVEMRDADGRLLDKLGEGDLYTDACAGNGEAARGVTIEDSLVYVLPCETADQLKTQNPSFAAHFERTLRARLQQALLSLHRPGVGADLMNVRVRELVGRAPVHAQPCMRIADAARLMSAERVSSLLLMQDGRLRGLITDRDLRSRCLAEGRSADEAVSTIMTEAVHTISADAPAFEALMLMTRLNIHHLPVVDAGAVCGLVSDTDLVRRQSVNAVYLADDIRKCSSFMELKRAAGAVPELQAALAGAGANPRQLGQAISSVADALTGRLIALAEQELGPAPVDYVWLAVASQARREQTAHSDQDNALLLGDDYDAGRHADYFEALAGYVNDGLNGCGFVYCPGEVMARNPQWRQPRRSWRRCFDEWIREPQRKALMLASNFFDMRPVHGNTALYETLQQEVLQQARSNGIFLAHLAANALSQRPPLGFFRNFVLTHGGEHDHTLDLKLRGLIPIVDLARLFAISAGIAEVNTAERLRAAVTAGMLSAEGGADLLDALELIASLRLHHQVERTRRGLAPDNCLDPNEISSLQRRHLKDAFAALDTVQQLVSQRYQTERLR